MNYAIPKTMAFLTLSAGIVSCSQNAEEASRPNIILIMSDDAGYSDVGCFGSEISTPNIDKLGYEGIRFSRFYSGAKCEPSRSSLFTGLYQGGERAVNLVKILRDQGYYTVHAGKEHFMSWVPESVYAAKVNDQSLTFWATTEYFEPPSGEFVRPFILNGKEVGIDQIYHEKKPFHKEDAATDNAIRWLDKPISRHQPFFLFLGYHAPHYPLQARPEDIEKYRGKYLMGWDRIREERFARQKELGLIPEWVELSPPSSNACNTPFRFFKQFGHEGGALVHALMWWPSMIEAGSINDVDEWEMYDLYEDPDEMNSIYGDPAYSEIQAMLHKRLEELRRQHGDSDELTQGFLQDYLNNRN